MTGDIPFATHHQLRRLWKFFSTRKSHGVLLGKVTRELVKRGLL